MGYVDEAFRKLKSNLEITDTEQEFAQKHHLAIRDYVGDRWTLFDDFLTGSYRRHTKTKKLKDVDIFVVLDREGPQGHYRDKAPAEVIRDLEAMLQDRWKGAEKDGMAVVIPFGPDDAVTSFDVVPAFKRAGGGYYIPNPGAGEWLATNPKVHHELSTAKNVDCEEKYVPFVKMVKGINRHLGEPVSPSFLLEVMALTLIKPPFGRYQDEMVVFLATAADRIGDVWLDPAGLGGDVNTAMNDAQKEAARAALLDARSIAERAVELEDDGQEHAAYAEWKKLFGDRMSKP